jgi:hypothetical protein
MMKLKSVLIPALFLLIGFGSSKVFKNENEKRLEALKILYLGTYINNRSFCQELSESITTGDTQSAKIQIIALANGLDMLISGLDQIIPLTDHEKKTIIFQPKNALSSDSTESESGRKIILK